MPRFTIGSLMTGLVLAVVAILALHALQGGGIVGLAPAPAAGPAPGAIDTATGAVMLDARAADTALHDSDTWDGGLDASTW
jgi:hypothetical protein